MLHNKVKKQEHKNRQTTNQENKRDNIKDRYANKNKIYVKEENKTKVCIMSLQLVSWSKTMLIPLCSTPWEDDIAHCAKDVSTPLKCVLVMHFTCQCTLRT